MENFVINTADDFNLYLMQLISSDNNLIKEDENIKKCLITNEPLNEHHITLKCNHSFNYLPLINEIINQKNYNSLEVTHLKTYQVKCPYCRNVQDGVIPYQEDIFPKKIKGINWPPSKVCANNTCSAIFRSGKRKGEICGKACVGKYCNKHKNFKVKEVKKKNKKINVTLCCDVIKSGKRKGEVCGAKCKEGFTKCGRHNKIKKDNKK